MNAPGDTMQPWPALKSLGDLAPFKDSPAAAGGWDMAERRACWHEWREFNGPIIQAMEAAFEEVTRP